MSEHPLRTRTLRILSALGVPLLAFALGTPPAWAAGTTKVSGTVMDSSGKPVAGVKVFFENQVVKQKIPPAKVNKKGKFSYPFLDISSGNKFVLRPEFTGDFKVLRVQYLSVDSFGATRDQGDKILDDSQELPTIQFFPIGQGTVVSGKNEVNITVVSSAKFAEERNKLLQARQSEKEGKTPEAISAEMQKQMELEQEQQKKEATLQTFQDAVKAAGQGRHEEAVEGFEAFLAVEPDNEKVHYELGKSLADLGRDQEAEAEFRKALSIDPAMPGPHFRLGMIYAGEEKFPEAEAEFSAELDNSPDNTTVMYNLAVSQMSQGKDQEAIASLQMLATEDPSNDEVHWKLAQLYEKGGDQAKANEQYEKFAEANPERAAKVFYNIGQEEFSKRNREEAAAAYKKAIEMDPEFADAYRQLGYCLVGMAEFDAAVVQFRKFLELEPASPHAKEVKDTIATLTK